MPTVLKEAAQAQPPRQHGPSPKDGRVDHLVCPGCLTHEEHIGMLVREAMTQVGITHDGRILTRPKFK